MKKIRVGTRKSELALKQARQVQNHLRICHPESCVELVLMDTAGDIDLDAPLPSVADKGFFTTEIEKALFDEDIDIAVHSLKDLPTSLSSGLMIGAYCERVDAHDVFLSKDGTTFANLPSGSRVGTSSLRRIAQLKCARPDIQCVDLRGNLNTRWRKLQEDENMDGMILAAAGVMRMGWIDRITEILSYDSFLPAPGQGIIAVECASGRQDVLDAIAPINHLASELSARAERTFLSQLDGGCQTPIGAIATVTDSIALQCAVFNLDGSQSVLIELSGGSADGVGREAARLALSQGAHEILAQTRIR